MTSPDPTSCTDCSTPFEDNGSRWCLDCGRSVLCVPCNGLHDGMCVTCAAEDDSELEEAMARAVEVAVMR